MEKDIDLKKVMGDDFSLHKNKKNQNHTYMENEKNNLKNEKMKAQSGNEMQKSAYAQKGENSKTGEKTGKNALNLKNQQSSGQKNDVSKLQFNAASKSQDEKKKSQDGKTKSQKADRPKKIRALSGAVIGLTIATSILGATTLGLGIAYGVTQSQANRYGAQIENIYKNIW